MILTNSSSLATTNPTTTSSSNSNRHRRINHGRHHYGIPMEPMKYRPKAPTADPESVFAFHKHLEDGAFVVCTLLRSGLTR